MRFVKKKEKKLKIFDCVSMKLLVLSDILIGNESRKDWRVTAVFPLRSVDGPNLYMTLHRRKVDDSMFCLDGEMRVHVPAGWQIADGSYDDVRVCGAHPWQSPILAFADGTGGGTAMCNNPSFRGNAQFALQ